METVQTCIASNPILGAALIILIGTFLLLAAIFDWPFIFGTAKHPNYNPEKLEGIINLFGRKTARLLCGALSVIIIGGGVIWIWAG